MGRFVVPRACRLGGSSKEIGRASRRLQVRLSLESLIAFEAHLPVGEAMTVLAQIEQIRTPVGDRDAVAVEVRQASLQDIARRVGTLCCPVLKRISHALRRRTDTLTEIQEECSDSTTHPGIAVRQDQDHVGPAPGLSAKSCTAPLQCWNNGKIHHLLPQIKRLSP